MILKYLVYHRYLVSFIRYYKLTQSATKVHLTSTGGFNFTVCYNISLGVIRISWKKLLSEWDHWSYEPCNNNPLMQKDIIYFFVLFQWGRILLSRFPSPCHRRSVDHRGHLGVPTSRPPSLETEVDPSNPADRFPGSRNSGIGETERDHQGHVSGHPEQHASWASGETGG